MTTPAMVAAVSDAAWLKALLRFESSLAAVESRLELIPETAAAQIASACDPGRFDLDAIGLAATDSAGPVVPLVDELRRAVGGKAARYVHFGATSQDAIDTAMMLISRDALELMQADLSALAAECAVLARRHRDDPMAGRTLLQRARPITFGLKCANWLFGVLEGRRSLVDFQERRLAVQLGGPVGTFDAFGERGFELMNALAEELGLTAPALPWHSTRARVAELGTGLAIASGAAAKIAYDLLLLAQTEVGEVAEANGGRSSSMPHKRNAAHAIEARAAFAGVVAQAGLLLGAVPGEHERSAGCWQAEWPAVSEAFRLAAGVVNRTREALTGLRVDPARMRANLSATDRAGEPVDVGASHAIVDHALAIYLREESK